MQNSGRGGLPKVRAHRIILPPVFAPYKLAEILRFEKMSPFLRTTLSLAIALVFGTLGAWVCRDSPSHREWVTHPKASDLKGAGETLAKQANLQTKTPSLDSRVAKASTLIPAPPALRDPRRPASKVPAPRLPGSAPAAAKPRTPDLATSNSGSPSGRPTREEFPSRRKLLQQAQKAEKAANHELDRLIATLDLNETQQDLVFEMLVRNSADFSPVMGTGSGLGDVVEPLLEVTESVDEAIAMVLDDSQAEKLLEDTREREAWWWATLQDFIPEEELPEGFVPGETYEP